MKTFQQLKQEAESVFETMPLPKEREEAWRHTSVERLKMESYPLTHVPSISLSSLNEESQKQGVVFCTLGEAIKSHHDIVQKALGSIPLLDKFVAFNCAKWQEGVLLYVPKNVEVNQTLSATFNTKGNAAMHNVIILEKGAKASYAEHYTYKEESETLHTIVSEVLCEDGALLQFGHLTQSSPVVRSVCTIHANVKRDANISWNWGAFGGKLNRLRIDSKLIGDGAQSQNIGMFITKGIEHSDATTNVYHGAENTTNDMKINGIMKGKSTAIYRGMIKIPENGKGTNSYLQNNIIKLSESAVANSIPALEIDNNEVKASHGATVSQIDSEQLFYLKSRGLSQEEAENLIVEGFFAPLLEKIEDETIRKMIGDAASEALR